MEAIAALGPTIPRGPPARRTRRVATRPDVETFRWPGLGNLTPRGWQTASEGMWEWPTARDARSPPRLDPRRLSAEADDVVKHLAIGAAEIPLGPFGSVDLPVVKQDDRPMRFRLVYADRFPLR